jgi:S1-C subfamily serine protease
MEPDSQPVIEGPFGTPDPGGSGLTPQPRPGGDAVLLHLTGPHRGTRQRLTETEALVGTARDAVVHFPSGSDPAVARRHALLVRAEDGWSVLEEEGQVYLNSADVPGLHGRETLVPGDILEIGSGGPVIRFLMETRARPKYKSLREAFRDCVDCATHGRGGRIRSLVRFIGILPRELLTQTTPRTRFTVAGIMVLLAASVGTLAAFTAFGLRLERRIEAEERRSMDVAESLGDLTNLPAEDPELRALVEDVEAVLTERIEALEAMSDASRRVVMAASPSVLFVQGGYHFFDEDTGHPLRVLIGPNGRPRMGPRGVPLTTLEGEGPLFEAQFTGSAWLVSEDGLLVTNRHIAIPWRSNSDVQPLLDRGFRPDLHLIGYVPGEAEPVELEFVVASEEHDLAVVRARDLVGRMPLELADHDAGPGEEILVLGYPAGIQALLARSGSMFVDSLMEKGPDFWSVVRGLSDAGFIRPLATRGIVGQVTPSTVAYDAETTSGGSGGPVLSMDGRVVAVTFAVLSSFGGSNLGVPVASVRRLLERAERETREAERPFG